MHVEFIRLVFSVWMQSNWNYIIVSIGMIWCETKWNMVCPRLWYLVFIIYNFTWHRYSSHGKKYHLVASEVTWLYAKLSVWRSNTSLYHSVMWFSSSEFMLGRYCTSLSHCIMLFPSAVFHVRLISYQLIHSIMRFTWGNVDLI